MRVTLTIAVACRAPVSWDPVEPVPDALEETP